MRGERGCKAGNSSTARILFLVPEWPASSSGVLHAQVLSPAKFLADNGFGCLFVGSDVSPDVAEESRRQIEELYGFKAAIGGCYSCRLGSIGLMATCRRAASMAATVISRFRPTHVYTRSILPCSVAKALRRKLGLIWVHDARATLAEEKALATGKRNWRYRMLLRKEIGAIRSADRVSCVSRNLREWIRENTGRQDAEVIPSCVDRTRWRFDSNARKSIRKQYSLEDHQPLVCYCGGLAKWQRVPDILSLFCAIARKSEVVRFLLLTKATDRMRTMLAESGVPLDRCIVLGCNHNEVGKYLSAADAGVIMRDDIIINNVASPIKIGEYLGCGLPVFLTRGIGDFGQAIADEGAGVLLNEEGDMAGQVIEYLVKRDKSERRGSAELFCDRFMSVDAYLETYRRLYQMGVK